MKSDSNTRTVDFGLSLTIEIPPNWDSLSIEDKRGFLCKEAGQMITARDLCIVGCEEEDDLTE